MKRNREQIGELLSAYVDGETDPRETEFVEHLLRKDESVRRQLEALRRTIHLVEQLPRHPSPPSIKEDIRNRIEREALLGAPEDSPAVASPRGTPRGAWLSVAAMIGLVLVTGVYFLRDRRPGPPGDRLAQLETRSTETWGEPLEAEEVRPAPRRKRSPRDASPPAPKQPVARETHPPRSAASRLRTIVRRDAPTKESSIAVATKQAGLRPDNAVKLKDKRAGGADVAASSTPRLADERLTLRIAVSDEASREAALRNLKAWLALQQAPSAVAREQRPAASESMSKGSYHRRASEVQYVDATSKRALIRMKARDLAPFVDELSRTTRSEDVSLIAGPLVFRGLKQTRRTLLAAVTHGLARNGTGAARPDPTARDTDRGRESEDDGAKEAPGASPALEELLEMFGVDPQWIRLASALQEPEKTADRPSLVERSLQLVKPAGAAKPEASDDAYVTLVVEFVVSREDRARSRAAPVDIKGRPSGNAKNRRFQE